MMALHAFTRYDFTSCFVRKGKVPLLKYQNHMTIIAMDQRPGNILPASIVDIMEQELETHSEDDEDDDEEWQNNRIQ